MTTTRTDERTPLLSSPTAVTPVEQNSADAPSSGDEDLQDPQALSKRTRNLVLFAVWMGVFLGALDTTVVASLVTDISSSFGASNQASWLGTSYLLSTAVFTPLYGKLADIIGRRYSSLLALSLFTIGTLLCGLAPSMLTLIMGRLIAGMGGGGMMAVSSVVASDMVPLKNRALAQGLANIFFGAGSGLGGPAGGFISDRLGWRSAFLLQVPLLTISIALVFINVRYRVPGQGKSKREMARRIDYFGSATLIVALSSLLFALSYKNNENLPWSHPLVWSLCIVFVVFAAAFVLVEGFVAAEPVMPLRILRQRNGTFVSLANFTLSATTFSILYFYPSFFEIVLSLSASQSGAHLLPNAIALSCGSLAAGFIIRKTGRYYWLIVITAACPVGALIGMAFLKEESGWVHLWLGIVPAGFGFASVVTSTLIALLSSLPRSDMAVASGITYLSRYVGQVIGVAVSSSILQSVLGAQLRKRITGPGAEETIDHIRHYTTSIPSLPPSLQISARASYLSALRAVFLFNAGVATVTLVSTLFLKEYPLAGSFAEEQEQEEERRRRSGESTPVERRGREE